MIEATGLTKRLGGRTVVSDVSFRCEPGAVTGFLGPNGAGKSTTMRMIVGLDRPCAGEALIAGRRYGQIEHPLRTVGALLDAGWVHPRRSARAHLRWLARSIGLPAGRVAEVLGTWGSPPWRTGRARTFSLGMRQRLGIAAALLGDPAVLLFDEPVNGLDPEGIRWMRRLLRDFADRGGTVLLSSHLLLEVEAVADQLVIIGDGKIVADGSREELLAGAGTLVRGDDGLDDALAAAGLEARADRRRRLHRRRAARGRRPRRAGRRRRPHPPRALRGRRAGAPVLRAHGVTRMNPSFPRLTGVELRKMVDTRAGFWLQLIVVVLTLAAVVLVCIFAPTDELVFRDLFALAITPASVLLPIVGILLVSSEWSQRTALITFTLVPKRMRVMGAKVAAGLVLGATRRGDRVRRRRRREPHRGRRVDDGHRRVRPDLRAHHHLDPHRDRVRCGVPELRAGDRALVRAPDRMVGARVHLVAQRRRRLARHGAHDRPVHRAARRPRPSGPSSAPRWRCGSCCRSRSASSAWRGARSALVEPAHRAPCPPARRSRSAASR